MDMITRGDLGVLRWNCQHPQVGRNAEYHLYSGHENYSVHE